MSEREYSRVVSRWRAFRKRMKKTPAEFLEWLKLFGPLHFAKGFERVLEDSLLEAPEQG